MEPRLSVLIAALVVLFGVVANALSLPEGSLKESQVGPPTPPPPPGGISLDYCVLIEKTVAYSSCFSFSFSLCTATDDRLQYT